MKVISKLKPLNEQTLLNLYEKLLSHLTHQWVSYDSEVHSWSVLNMNSDTSKEKEHWSEMKTSEAEMLFQFFHNLQIELSARHKTFSQTMNGDDKGLGIKE